MEKSEFIEFDSIRLSSNLQSTSFAIYLKEVFSDLSQRQDSEKDQGISKITFSEYMKLPIFITNKFFASLDKDNDNFLNFKEFSNGMNKLYLGNFEETANIVFNVFDFDKDGIIKKADVKLLLSYLPIKSTDEKNTFYKNQMESLEELDEILAESFGKSNENLNFEEFLTIIENKKSDIYVQLICFFYFKKPFEENTVNQYKKLKKIKGDDNSAHGKAMVKRRSNENNVNSNNNKHTEPATESKRLISPSRKTKFSPAENYLQINAIRRLSCEESKSHNSSSSKSPKMNIIDSKQNTLVNNFKITLNSVQEKESPKKSMANNNHNRKVSTIKLEYNNSNSISNNEFLRMPNRKINSNHSKQDYDEILKNSQNYFDSPTKIIKKTLPELNDMSELNINMVPIAEDNEEGNKNNFYNPNNNNLIPVEDVISLEDYLYILEKENKIKKNFVSLFGKEMSIYKSNLKDDLISLQNLSGCFIKDLGSEAKVFEKEKYYGFAVIISKDKQKVFYCNKLDLKNTWVKNVKKAIGYEIFTDYYEVTQVLGEGLFGIVKKGTHKKSNKIVAVKIINKDKLRPGEIDLIRTEIDLMKLFQHPNIVKLIDHFENAESIYIVMEYLEGGTLLDYMEDKNLILSEKIIAKILYCVGTVIKYLNSYGVIHRDLKPENIMLLDKSDNPLIKIIDFGLTRTLAAGEKLAEGFGTITYVAPEVLTRKPYNKQIDIWSMGVILYFLLTGGKLPFDDENNNEEIIAKKALLMDPLFPDEYFSKRSKTAKLLINDCLVKDPEKRITIDNFMKNEWLKANYNAKENVINNID